MSDTQNTAVPRRAEKSTAATEQPTNSLAAARIETDSNAAAQDATDQPGRVSAADPGLVPDAESDAGDDAAAAELGDAGDLPANFKRRPFGSHLPKLSYPQRPGYRRYWFNDKPGRVARAKEAGYTNVNEDGKPVMRVVTGGGLRSFLMEIPRHWFDDDMKAQQKQVDEIDRAIRGGDLKRTDGDQRYVPKHAIKIRTE